MTGCGYAPRAREDSMRPRRLLGASVQPLNFTVRRRCYSVRASAVVATTAAFAGLGPPLGSAVALIFSVFLGPSDARGHMILGLVPILIVIQLFAFMIGEVPALITGFVVALLAHWVPQLFVGPLWQRAMLGGLLGAVTGVLWDLFSRRQFVATHNLPFIVASNLLFVAAISGVPGGILGGFFPLRSWVAGAPSNNRWRGP